MVTNVVDTLFNINENKKTTIKERHKGNKKIAFQLGFDANAEMAEIA